jgi:glycerol uptake facilitator-like aquaporin
MSMNIRALAAEGLGTGLLVATVVGSGIMAERLSGGNVALALLANTVATGAVLYVLISLLGPVSGAHFNPVVTLIHGQARDRMTVIPIQIAGACIGTFAAHLMFAMPLFSNHVAARSGAGQWLGEFIATFGLLFVIRVGSVQRIHNLPALIALWIVAAYWFTSSTSFANPAVTIGRALTGSFAGIRWIDVPPFIIAQLVGGLVGHWCGEIIAPEKTHESHHLA